VKAVAMIGFECSEPAPLGDHGNVFGFTRGNFLGGTDSDAKLPVALRAYPQGGQDFVTPPQRERFAPQRGRPTGYWLRKIVSPLLISMVSAIQPPQR